MIYKLRGNYSQSHQAHWHRLLRLRGDRNFKQAVEYVVENCGGEQLRGGDRLYGFEGDILAKQLKTTCVP